MRLHGRLDEVEEGHELTEGSSFSDLRELRRNEGVMTSVCTPPLVGPPMSRIGTQLLSLQSSVRIALWVWASLECDPEILKQ